MFCESCELFLTKNIRQILSKSLLSILNTEAKNLTRFNDDDVDAMTYEREE